MQVKLVRFGAVIICLVSILIFSHPVMATSSGATISAVPSVQTVSPGSNFDLHIVINVGPSVQTRSMECTLTWDPTKVQCNSVTDGTFYQSFATANNGSVVVMPHDPPSYDNTNGTFPTVVSGSNPPTSAGIAMIGGNYADQMSGTLAGPSGSGDAFVLHMTAKSGASGTATFTFSQVLINDNSTAPVSLNATGVSGQITISSATSTPAPSITSFSPTSGVSGAHITINGTGLTGATSVTFGGTAATIVSNTDTQIVAAVGNGASGSVTVNTAGGMSSKSGFTFLTLPAISSFTPVSGGGGTYVIIVGTNFTGATGVSIGGTAAQSYTVNSSTQITAVVGSGTTGVISVSTAAGTASSSGSFTYTVATTTTIATTTTTDTNSATTTTTTTTSTTTTPTTTTSTTTTPTTTTSTTTTPTTTTSTTTTPIITTSTATTPTTARPQSVQTVTSQTNDTGTLTTTLDVSNSMDTSGILHDDFNETNISLGGKNEIVSLEINSGTRLVASDGSPVESISIQPNNILPEPPTGETVISGVEFGPTGTTFSSPITVVFGYDTTQVPKNTEAKNLSIEYFDTQANKWVMCDYTVDTQNHQITANISHFSLYAILLKNTGGVGVGWSTAGIVIAGELLAGLLLTFLLMNRRRSPVPVGTSQSEAHINSGSVPLQTDVRRNEEVSKVVWDDLLKESQNKGVPFKTTLEIIGGRVLIPRDDKSSEIELVNMPNSHIMISLEYDPELHPKGSAKIVILGSVPESVRIKDKEK